MHGSNSSYNSNVYSVVQLVVIVQHFVWPGDKVTRALYIMSFGFFSSFLSLVYKSVTAHYFKKKKEIMFIE
jgi:hypothetical protein